MIVYRHRRLDTYEVFYVGIGKTERRSYSKCNRNKYWKNIVNKVGYVVEILTEVETWEEACELEMLLISEYGRKDLGLGNLVNMTDGGDGRLGIKCSKETRSKMSENLKGNKRTLGYKHSEETKKKMSKIHKGNKHNIGRIHTEETKKKLSISKTGIKNGRAKLTEQQVYEIKYSNFKMSYREIGVMYGVDKTSVYDIRNNRSWKHI